MDKPTHYTARAIRGISMMTLYAGVSKERALAAIDNARGILILGGGSATLTLANGHGFNVPQWIVEDGHASKP